MRLIVTGSAGFIGSILCRRAAEDGHVVLALDDESRGLNPVWTVPGVDYRRFDCLAFPPPGIGAVDAVVHLAAGTGSLTRPLDELRRLNVTMTQRVFEGALTLGAKVFAWPTTSLALEVPDSPYVQSKEEALKWLLARPERKSVLPLRFFNVTGAYKGFSEFRQHEVHILPSLVAAYRNGTPFPINGADYHTADGTSSRDFVHVLDVVDYMLHWIERQAGGEAPVPGPDGAVWVGTGRATTVGQLIRLFQQFIGPVQTAAFPRRAFDAGGLHCHPVQVAQLAAFRPPAPAWVGIRDEIDTLLSHKE